MANFASTVNSTMDAPPVSETLGGIANEQLDMTRSLNMRLAGMLDRVAGPRPMPGNGAVEQKGPAGTLEVAKLTRAHLLTGHALLDELDRLL